MRALLLTFLVLALAGTAGAASASDGVQTTLDLTNWGFGIFYLTGSTLGHESNGLEGWQDVPVTSLDGEVAGDIMVLP